MPPHSLSAELFLCSKCLYLGRKFEYLQCPLNRCIRPPNKSGPGAPPRQARSRSLVWAHHSTTCPVQDSQRLLSLRTKQRFSFPISPGSRLRIGETPLPENNLPFPDPADRAEIVLVLQAGPNHTACVG